jgi:RHS repeat-associated protein
MRVEVTGSTTAYRKYFGSFAERDPNDTTACEDQPAKGCLKFYHGDHLGSSTLVVELENTPSPHTPTVVHRQAYTPYGLDIVPAAPGPFSPKYQFNFKERETDGTDDRTVFYDYGARMYNPATGRWLSPDSVTRDNYEYASNSPERYTDPTGHDPQDSDQANVPAGWGGMMWWYGGGSMFWGLKAQVQKLMNYGSWVPLVGEPLIMAEALGDMADGHNGRAALKLGGAVLPTGLPLLSDEGGFARVYAHRKNVLKVMRDLTFFDEQARSTVEGSNAIRKALRGIIDVPLMRLGRRPGWISQRRVFGFTYKELSKDAQAAAAEEVGSLRPRMTAAVEKANIGIHLDSNYDNFIYTKEGKPLAFFDPVLPFQPYTGVPIQPTGR